jgi:hypothetical protein
LQMWKSLRWRLSVLWILKGWKSFRNRYTNRSVTMNKQDNFQVE